MCRFIKYTSHLEKKLGPIKKDHQANEKDITYFINNNLHCNLCNRKEMETLGRILVKCLRYRQCGSISSFKKYRHYKYPLT